MHGENAVQRNIREHSNFLHHFFSDWIGGAARDDFGASVSVSGDTAVVGAFLDDVGANVDQGSEYVFVRSGTVWTEESKLTAADGAAGDEDVVVVVVGV